MKTWLAALVLIAGTQAAAAQVHVRDGEILTGVRVCVTREGLRNRIAVSAKRAMPAQIETVDGCIYRALTVQVSQRNDEFSGRSGWVVVFDETSQHRCELQHGSVVDYRFPCRLSYERIDWHWAKVLKPDGIFLKANDGTDLWIMVEITPYRLPNDPRYRLNPPKQRWIEKHERISRRPGRYQRDTIPPAAKPCRDMASAECRPSTMRCVAVPRSSLPQCLARRL